MKLKYTLRPIYFLLIYFLFSGAALANYDINIDIKSDTLPCNNNGSCFSAEIINIISGEQCVEGCNVGMPDGPLISSGGPCFDMTNAAAWYKFNSGDNNSASFSFSSEDLLFPTYAIYSNCFSFLSCNPSQIDLTNNTDYFIVITDSGGNEGEFQLCVNLKYITAPCITEQSLNVIGTSLGSPLDGPYKSCEEVTFSYKTNFFQLGAQWIHSIVPIISDCFEYEQGTEPSNAIVPNGNAAWKWYPSGSTTWKPLNNLNSLVGIDIMNGKICLLGSPDCIPLLGGGNCSESGTTMPAGWIGVVNSGTCASNHPNLSWGDSNPDVKEVIFTLKIPCDAHINPICNEYKVSIISFSDGQTGGYQSSACNGHTMVSKLLTLNFCQFPELEYNSLSLCNNDTFKVSYKYDDPLAKMEWVLATADSVEGAFPGSGSFIEQHLINKSNSIKHVTYYITPFKSDSCLGTTDTVVVEVLPEINLELQDSVFSCPNELINLTSTVTGAGNFNVDYIWSVSNLSAPEIQYASDVSEKILLEVISEHGCRAVDSTYLTVFQNVEYPNDSTLSGNLIVINGEILNYSISAFPQATNYIWKIDSVIIGLGQEIEAEISQLTLGTHQLCVNAVNDCDSTGKEICWQLTVLANHQSSDCITADTICNKSLVTIDFGGNFGNIQEWPDSTLCYEFALESNVKWLFWEIKQAGKLWFTLFPQDSVMGDLDFVVYRSVSGCEDKIPVRCMFSGWEPDCLGPTGLSPFETDSVEMANCYNGSNSFVKALDCEVGDKYFLAVNDFSKISTSFQIEFCGSALMMCDTTNCELLQKNEIVNSALTIYPNPNDGSFNLELGEHHSGGKVKIFNYQGTCVQTKTFNQNSDHLYVELNHPQPGIYFIIIEDNSGRSNRVGKVVVLR